MYFSFIPISKCVTIMIFRQVFTHELLIIVLKAETNAKAPTLGGTLHKIIRAKLAAYTNRIFQNYKIWGKKKNNEAKS